MHTVSRFFYWFTDNACTAARVIGWQTMWLSKYWWDLRTAHCSIQQSQCQCDVNELISHFSVLKLYLNPSMDSILNGLYTLYYNFYALYSIAFLTYFQWLIVLKSYLNLSMNSILIGFYAHVVLCPAFNGFSVLFFKNDLLCWNHI